MTSPADMEDIDLGVALVCGILEALERLIPRDAFHASLAGVFAILEEPAAEAGIDLAEAKDADAAALLGTSLAVMKARLHPNRTRWVVGELIETLKIPTRAFGLDAESLAKAN